MCVLRISGDELDVETLEHDLPFEPCAVHHKGTLRQPSSGAPWIDRATAG